MHIIKIRWYHNCFSFSWQSYTWEDALYLERDPGPHVVPCIQWKLCFDNFHDLLVPEPLLLAMGAWHDYWSCVSDIPANHIRPQTIYEASKKCLYRAGMFQLFIYTIGFLLQHILHCPKPTWQVRQAAFHVCFPDKIQCGTVIMQSIFSQILTVDTS